MSVESVDDGIGPEKKPETSQNNAVPTRNAIRAAASDQSNYLPMPFTAVSSI